MPHHGTETEFELTTLKRLEALGYSPVFGMDGDQTAFVKRRGEVGRPRMGE